MVIWPHAAGVKPVPSRNTRILLGVGALALLSLGLVVVAYAIGDQERARIDIEAARVDAIDEQAGVLSDSARDAQIAIDVYIFSGEEEALAEYDGAVGRESEALRILDGIEGEPAEVSANIEVARTSLVMWRADVAEPVIEAVRAGDEEALDILAGEVAEDHEAVDGAIEGLIARVDAERATLNNHTTEMLARTRQITIAAFGGILFAFVLALWMVRRYGRVLERDARHAGVLNQFTEVTSFAADDHEVAASNIIALGRLARPDASVTHILNRSKDRAVPEAVTGAAPADVLPLHALNRCAGLVRGSLYVTDDLADDLSVHCPVFPATAGTLACVPLMSGEPVGAVHLYWNRPNSLALEDRSNIARVAEHAALAIGNRRLLAALEGQANTDPKTGLANNRAFDKAIEESLAGRAANESLTVLMIDIDHFKALNDRHGHPAGDDALRAFARVLSSCMREGDVAARYGGEEFAVLLPEINAVGGLAIAERIRSRTESTIISLAPGLTDRMTISIGLATAPNQALDRVSLLSIADEALYEAKAGGRNRVVSNADLHAKGRPRKPPASKSSPGTRSSAEGRQTTARRSASNAIAESSRAVAT